MPTHRLSIAVGILLCLSLSTARAAIPRPADLTAVREHRSPAHAPVVLVERGEPVATVCMMCEKPSRELRSAIAELQDCVEAASGAKLPLLQGELPEDGPAIVIGDCEEARRQGLVGSKMPVEGFAVKTAADRVYVVGHDDAELKANGTAWGVYELLERFLNVRFYWPAEHGGRDVPQRATIRLEAVWISDAPVYRQRDIWPTLGPLVRHHAAMRGGNSWPIKLVVHSPRSWRKIDWIAKRPEVFQKRLDGSRDEIMLCYGNSRTLATYLEVLSRRFDREEELPDGAMGIRGNAITVSPWDAGIACYCDDCQRMLEPDRGPFGSASRILGEFVAKLGREVKKRWPDKTVIYLPYLNYTLAPEGIVFPDNVEVQLCGMPGLAQYKEPELLQQFQTNIDRWRKLTGRKVQTWEYSCWPEDRTKVPYHYPHVLQEYYRSNRTKLVGSFINGSGDHWPRQNVSLYCWMKLLWDPEVNVDAVMDEFCRRMFGPAAGTMHQLLRLQVDGWEKSRWPEGRLSAKAIYEHSFPPSRIQEMKSLLDQARRQVGADALFRQRLDYYETPFAPFYREAQYVLEGKGARPLVVQKVSENPTVDGKLDEEAWRQATATRLMKFDSKAEKEVPATFATDVKAVWTLDGVTIGYRMEEPRPETLKRDKGSRDDGTLYWQDCAEIFLDPSGQNEGDWYQILVTAGGAILDMHAGADAHGGDTAWNCEGLKTASHLGKDFWSMEIFVPLSAFPGALKPGTGIEWYGQFCRHRLADHQPLRENQKMNAHAGGFNSNTADFAPLRFVE